MILTGVVMSGDVDLDSVPTLFLTGVGLMVTGVAVVTPPLYRTKKGAVLSFHQEATTALTNSAL
jgi:hypothetical protein